MDQEEAQDILEPGNMARAAVDADANVIAAVAGADVVRFPDVSYPEKRNRRSWKSTSTN